MRILSASIAALLLAACSVQAGAATKKPLPKARIIKVSQAAGPLYAGRADAMLQADAIAQAQGLDRDWVRNTIGQGRYTASIAKAILPPPAGVAKNWSAYRSRFVEPKRIQAGTQFWLANQDSLRRAEEETGVPARIIVGIIGVETIYGQNTGNFRVIDALCTLAFDFPKDHPKAAARAAFFRNELEEYLVLTARTHTDPLALRGSYAGALGWPQFMPSSWNRYAVDFDGDGRVDLFNSQADVIGSVANYFKAFNWQRGMPTHYQVHWDADKLDLPTLLAADITPTFTVAELAAKGVLLDAPDNQHQGLLALIELQNGDAPPVYVVGTDNFYAITRYNWSSYYAMAVIDLGNAVSDAVAAVVQQRQPVAQAAASDASMPK